MGKNDPAEDKDGKPELQTSHGAVRPSQGSTYSPVIGGNCEGCISRHLLICTLLATVPLLPRRIALTLFFLSCVPAMNPTLQSCFESSGRQLNCPAWLSLAGARAVSKGGEEFLDGEPVIAKF